MGRSRKGHESWHDWHSRKHEKNVKEGQDSWVVLLVPAALRGGIVSGAVKPSEKLVPLNLQLMGMFVAV